MTFATALAVLSEKKKKKTSLSCSFIDSVFHSHETFFKPHGHLKAAHTGEDWRVWLSGRTLVQPAQRPWFESLVLERKYESRAWWPMALIPTARRQRQADY